MTPRVDSSRTAPVPGVGTNPGGALLRTEPATTNHQSPGSTSSSVPASIIDAWLVPAAPVPVSASSPEDVPGASTYALAASLDNLGASPLRIAPGSLAVHEFGGTTTTEHVQDHISAPALSNSTTASTRPRTRLQGGIRKPKVYIDGTIKYGCLASVNSEPNNISEALANDN
jgi:hypothetical protein